MLLLRDIALLAVATPLLIFAAVPSPLQEVPAQVQPVAQTTSTNQVLRANSNLVLVDVVVTNRGNAVHGLDAKQFHIFEDGTEQTITSFDEHKPGETSAPLAKPSIIPATLPPHTYSNVPAYPPASAVNVLLLDGLNTPTAGQMEVRRQMLQYMSKIVPGTSLAIFTLSSRLRLLERFTTDPAELTRSLKIPKEATSPSVILDPQTDQALDSTIGDMANMGGGSNTLSDGANPLSTMQQFIADETAFQTDQRVQMTLEAMQQLARYLSGIPGRKNLIWFSGSFPIALDPDDSLNSPFDAMRTYADQVRETATLLSAARVAVYPVDARGLMTPLSLDASYSPTTNIMSATVNGGRGGKRSNGQANKPNAGKDNANFTKQTMAENATMQQIAVETGGKDYLNTNGLKEAVASAVADGSSYYTLGFVPPAKSLDGQFHKLQVRTDNGAFKLAYRAGYYADASDKSSAHNPGSSSLIVTTTMRGAPPSTQVLFQARVLPSDDPTLKGSQLPAGPAGEMSASLHGSTQRAIVDVKMDPHGLAIDDGADGSRTARIEFVLVAYDADGNRVNYLDRGFQLDAKSEKYARAMQNGIPIRLALDLPAGPVNLRIAVHDLNGDRAGSLEIPFGERTR